MPIISAPSPLRALRGTLGTGVPHLQRTEVREVEESFGQEQKGSLPCPTKEPITAEKLCGLARILRGNMLAAMETSLWHERDISHSSVERIIIPTAHRFSTTC